jgi:hypothetical protein
VIKQDDVNPHVQYACATVWRACSIDNKPSSDNFLWHRSEKEMERKNLSGWSVPLDDILSYSNSDQAAVKCQLSTLATRHSYFPIRSGVRKKFAHLRNAVSRKVFLFIFVCGNLPEKDNNRHDYTTSLTSQSGESSIIGHFQVMGGSVRFWSRSWCHFLCCMLSFRASSLSCGPFL